MTDEYCYYTAGSKMSSETSFKGRWGHPIMRTHLSDPYSHNSSWHRRNPSHQKCMVFTCSGYTIKEDKGSTSESERSAAFRTSKPGRQRFVQLGSSCHTSPIFLQVSSVLLYTASTWFRFPYRLFPSSVNHSVPPSVVPSASLALQCYSTVTEYEPDYFWLQSPIGDRNMSPVRKWASPSASRSRYGGNW